MLVATDEVHKLTLHADEKNIAPALAGDKSTALPMAFEKSIGRHSCTHTNRLDTVEAELLVLGDLPALELAEDTANSDG